MTPKIIFHFLNFLPRALLLFSRVCSYHLCPPVLVRTEHARNRLRTWTVMCVKYGPTGLTSVTSSFTSISDFDLESSRMSDSRFQFLAHVDYSSHCQASAGVLTIRIVDNIEVHFVSKDRIPQSETFCLQFSYSFQKGAFRVE